MALSDVAFSWEHDLCTAVIITPRLDKNAFIKVSGISSEIHMRSLCLFTSFIKLGLCVMTLPD